MDKRVGWLTREKIILVATLRGINSTMDIVALANLDSSQLDSLKQPSIEGVFNLLEVCVENDRYSMSSMADRIK
jgi:hypothetical protein